jgi:polysaccharide biosynthesis/export protein
MQPPASGGETAAKLAAVRELESVTSASKPGTGAYKIGPLDVLDISVFKVPELSKSVQVADTGSVNLPLVGEVPVAGRTAQEVERNLTTLLGKKYLQSPQVTVFVKEYNSQRVTIEGAVKKPGVYPIRGKTTLLQFIATAEGLTDAAEQDVAVFRDVEGTRSVAKFNIENLRTGLAADPAVQQGDVIVVNTSAAKLAFQNFLKLVPATNAFAPFL